MRIKRLFKIKSGIYLYRPQYELRKIMWEFNPYDNDENPNLSIPHGDDYYPTHHTLKLNVDNGQIFTARNREYWGKISKKERKRLLDDEGFKKVKEVAIEFRNNKKTTFEHQLTEIYRFELLVQAYKYRKL